MSLTHFDAQGQAHMVDVGAKASTHRLAVASGRIHMLPATLALIQAGTAKKGDVLGIARIAGIQASKKTSDLIPLCHPLGLDSCKFETEVLSDQIVITCICLLEAKTGVEMEALVGASVAALTVYDMCKSVSKGIVIKETKLISKAGGKSDFNA